MRARPGILLIPLLLGACSGIVVDDVPSPVEKKPPVVRPRLSPEERRHLEEKVEALIKLLGSEEYAARERAGRDIFEIGSAALEKLGEAVKSDDIEIAVRAQRLIEKIKHETTQARMELHKAILMGNVAAVREMAERNWSLLDVELKGQTWLHKAAQAGQAKVADLFIKWGIPVDVRDDRDRTPLHFASTVEVVRLLAGSGTDVNTKDEGGLTPLHFAAGTEVVRMLIASGADPDIADRRGRTALHGAVRVNNHKICEELCRQGANINAKDSMGDTPLDIARAMQHKDLAAILQSYGGEAGGVCRSIVYAIEDGDTKGIKRLLGQGADVNMKDRDDVSLLHHAVRTGKLEIVKLLIDEGASTDVRDASGRNLLRYTDKAEIGGFLIEAGCKVDARDDYGETALHAAVLANREEMVKLLIARSADVDAADNLGNTPLHVAARFGSYDTAGLLVAASADVNAGNNAGDRPLDIAKEAYSDKIADMLRKCGARSHRDSLALLGAVEQGKTKLAAKYLPGDADINMKSPYGMAALHIAAARGDAELVELLIKAGADLNAHGSFRRTALHEAVFRGYRQTVEVLVRTKAEVNHMDAFGETPLDDADEDDRELIDYLRKHGARTAAELTKTAGE